MVSKKHPKDPGPPTTTLTHSAERVQHLIGHYLVVKGRDGMWRVWKDKIYLYARNTEEEAIQKANELNQLDLEKMAMKGQKGGKS